LQLCYKKKPSGTQGRNDYTLTVVSKNILLRGILILINIIIIIIINFIYPQIYRLALGLISSSYLMLHIKIMILSDDDDNIDGNGENGGRGSSNNNGSDDVAL